VLITSRAGLKQYFWLDIRWDYGIIPEEYKKKRPRGVYSAANKDLIL
jgi:hypothetical protein